MTLTSETPPTLTTSRASRLLRPLLNKSSSLSLLSLPSTQVGYATRHRPEEHASLPLAITPPPHKLIHLRSDPAQTSELSRRIYAALDAFKNVLQGAHGSSSVPSESESCVPSLASMCSAIVGENLSYGAEDEPGHLDDDKDGDYDPANDIFDAVPVCYRRFVISSQALDLLLRASPHNVTLLYNALQICLSHRLGYLSLVVLESLLRSATSSATPPLCHPAHSGFLTNLLALWIDHGGGVRAFTRSVAEAFSHSLNIQLWKSKAATALLNELHTTDLGSLAVMLIGSIDTFLSLRSAGPEALDSAGVEILTDFVLRWTHKSFQHVTSNPNKEDLNCMVAFLTHVYSHGAHAMVYSASIGSDRHRKSNSIISLAIYLTSELKNHLDPHAIPALLSLLRESTPCTSTCTTLVTHILSSETQPTPLSAPVSVHSCKRQVMFYAQFLRSQKLLKLEASFLACALRHVESPAEGSVLASHDGQKEHQRWRDELIELVDDAERRCFSHTEEPFQPRDTWRSRRYRWEDTVGCWVVVNSTATQSNDAIPARHHRRSSGPARSASSSSILQNLSNGQWRKRQSVPSLGRAHAMGRDSSPRPLKRTRTDFASILTIASSNRDELHPRIIPMRQENYLENVHNGGNLRSSTSSDSYGYKPGPSLHRR